MTSYDHNTLNHTNRNSNTNDDNNNLGNLQLIPTSTSGFPHVEEYLWTHAARIGAETVETNNSLARIGTGKNRLARIGHLWKQIIAWRQELLIIIHIYLSTCIYIYIYIYTHTCVYIPPDREAKPGPAGPRPLLIVMVITV